MGPEPLDADTQGKIVAAAARLIAESGQQAATTRAVAAAAGVQPPTIYRLFGDKMGMLDAVIEHGYATYVSEKSRRRPHADPVEDLRRGWDMHVAFGLENPELFRLMTSRPTDTPSIAAGRAVLEARVHRIAAEGRLRVSEARALALIEAGCTGTVLTLLAAPEDERDPNLTEMMRESVIQTITGDAGVSRDAGPSGVAAALRAQLNDAPALSAGERLLLSELLERLANAG